MRDCGHYHVTKGADHHVTMESTSLFLGHSALFRHLASGECVLPRSTRAAGVPICDSVGEQLQLTGVNWTLQFKASRRIYAISVIFPSLTDALPIHHLN
jgi:hypothetical protein